jgi:predicted RNase H-like HicB family nuclease
VIDKLIKPMQSRGLWGPRDIHKKVLEPPIPQFDSRNAIHRQLAKLGKDCSDKVEQWRVSGGAGKIKSIGKLRGMVREMLRDELQEIDILVKEILNILSEYVDQAMEQAVYDKLEDNTFAGRIPSCKGVVAFGATLRECEDELRSTLEDWIRVGLKLGHPLPVIGDVDLNSK